MIRHFLLIIFCLTTISMFSQNESAIWYFGYNAGLDFNTGDDPSVLLNGQLITKEGCATISDANGSLLFYTDGRTVWDRQHQVMPNGEGLLGHSSSTESALIIPKPGNSNSYYIFTIDKPSYFLTEDEPIDGVNYSEVDMTLNNGLGDVVDTQKNIHLITYDVNNATQSEYKSSEKITAVTHSDGSAVWVITHFRNKFYAFLVDYTGVVDTPVVSSVQQMVEPRINEEGANVTAIGYLKVSPDGEKIAIAHSSTNLGSPRNGTKKSGKVLLYDFNNATGVVSNQKNVISNTYPYGVEFSPNSELLYVTTSVFDEDDLFVKSYLYQYQTEAANVEDTQQTVNNSSNVAGALQLAINGKIYRAGYPVFGEGEYLSVINNPNGIGSTCNYSHNSLFLEGKTAQLGLPPFIQSIFLYTFDYEFTCLGDTTHFFITSEEPYDTVEWNFGDGQTSTNEEAYHFYDQPGTYTATLTLSINGVEYDPMVKQINISEAPNVMQNTYDLVQCDSYDNDPNDGIATFNLALANGPLTFNTSEAIQVYYYHSEAEAIADEHNSNALNNVYENQYQGEILYAKVYKANTQCFNIASIRLETTQSVDLNSFELETCDLDNSGIAEFDLNNAVENIVNTLNLPTNVNVTFHETQQDAAIGINAVPLNYTSSSTSLYIRAESDNVCYGGGVLELIVKDFPLIDDQTINVCPSEFPIIIDSGLSNSDVSNFNYLWNTNDTTNQIYINEPGIYNLTIIDPALNCEKHITVTVNQIETAQVESIVINDYDVTINLITTIGDFVFSLDDPNGIYQPSNVFTNVEAGSHTIYIKDLFNCNISSETFNIIGFPKYFTPNNDGRHDTWNIKGLDPNDYPDITIYIFNRYGKLLKAFNPNTSNGWDGLLHGKLLTPDDYWYYLKLPEGKEYRGHFSLKI